MHLSTNFFCFSLFSLLQVKLNLKRPGNLAYLASASVNLAALTSAHAQLVKQKDVVTVLCLLSAYPKLVEVGKRPWLLCFGDKRGRKSDSPSSVSS